MATALVARAADASAAEPAEAAGRAATVATAAATVAAAMAAERAVARTAEGAETCERRRRRPCTLAVQQERPAAAQEAAVGWAGGARPVPSSPSGGRTCTLSKGHRKGASSRRPEDRES